MVDIDEIVKRTGMTRNNVCVQLKRGIAPEDVRPRRRGYGGGRKKTHLEWDKPLEDHPEALAAIDVAEELGGLTVLTISQLLGVSTSRVNAIIRTAIRKIEAEAKCIISY